MAIEYRSIDADAATKEANRNSAIEHEMRAFGAEVEVERLTEVLKTVETAGDQATVTDLLENAKSDAEAHRARAHEAKSGTDISDEDDINAHKEFLNRWVQSLEQEHLSHEILISQREASLAITGTGVLSPEEQEAAMDEIRNSRDALRIIETSWHVATKRLDALNKPKPRKKS
jgi:hypothetical protein